MVIEKNNQDCGTFMDLLIKLIFNLKPLNWKDHFNLGPNNHGLAVPISSIFGLYMCYNEFFSTLVPTFSLFLLKRYQIATK